MLAVSGDTVRLFLHVLAATIRWAARSRTRKTVWVAVFGVLTGLSALGALFLGAALAG